MTAQKAIRIWLANQGENGQTQRWLAEKIAVSTSTLSRVLSGKQPITDELVKALERETNIDLSALRGIRSTRTPSRP
jgi:antitoxin component HigA of HigAB toxin-antitoxin module